MILYPKTLDRKVLLIALRLMFIAWCFGGADIGNAGPYLDSAHGNNEYGVDRSSIDSQYADFSTGNCAHCHEMHTSMDGVEPLPTGAASGPRAWLLFDKHWAPRNPCSNQTFCYDCHKNIVPNYPYSVSFGGQDLFYGSIMQQFCDNDSEPVNCGSRHSLEAITLLIKNNFRGWGFPSKPDPCSACHNPHFVQRVGSKRTSNYEPSNSPISRPSDHEGLWGDDPDERMNAYAVSVGGIYQAPFYSQNPSSYYEPAGSTTSDGSDLPDYVTFCLDCHKDPQYDPERDKTVKAINWGSNGDRHGGYPSNTCNQGLNFEGTLRPPYEDSPNSKYVLSCTDCHEPHGSKKRLHLIRRMINGEFVAKDVPPCDQIVEEDWVQICARCHNIQHPTFGGCFETPGCHGHGDKWADLGDCSGEPTF